MTLSLSVIQDYSLLVWLWVVAIAILAVGLLCIVWLLQQIRDDARDYYDYDTEQWELSQAERRENTRANLILPHGKHR